MHSIGEAKPNNVHLDPVRTAQVAEDSALISIIDESGCRNIFVFISDTKCWLIDYCVFRNGNVKNLRLPSKDLFWFKITHYYFHFSCMNIANLKITFSSIKRYVYCKCGILSFKSLSKLQIFYIKAYESVITIFLKSRVC